MHRLIATIWLILCANIWAVELGKIPPLVVLEGKSGGTVNGKTWKSSMLKGKVYVLFYVDPDVKELNRVLYNTLKRAHFSSQDFGSVAVVNMAATWKPNLLLKAIVKQKQKEFPRTLYVFDKDKKLLKAWGLGDNNSDVLIFDKEGRLIYQKFGELSRTEIQQILNLIQEHL